MRHRFLHRPLPLVVALLAYMLLRCGDLHEDEVECEEAVEHLKTCCKPFAAGRLHCESARSSGTSASFAR